MDTEFTEQITSDTEKIHGVLSLFDLDTWLQPQALAGSEHMFRENSCCFFVERGSKLSQEWCKSSSEARLMRALKFWKINTVLALMCPQVLQFRPRHLTKDAP